MMVRMKRRGIGRRVLLGGVLCGLVLLGSVLSARSVSHDTPAAPAAGAGVRGEAGEPAAPSLHGLLASVQALGRTRLSEGFADHGEIGPRSLGPTASERVETRRTAVVRPDPPSSLLVLGALGLACLLVMGRRNAGAETEGDRPWLLTEFSGLNEHPGRAQVPRESAARAGRGLEAKPPTG